MKKITSIIIVLFIAAYTFAGEGITVVQKYKDATTPNADITITWYITDNNCKMKMQLNDKNISTSTNFIPDAGSGVVLTYADGAAPAGTTPTYYSIPLNRISATTTATVGNIKVVQTGETKTISGLVCEKVMIFAATSETEVWITKDFKPAFYQFYKYFRNDLALMALNAESLKGVPLMVTTKDLSGNVISSATLVSAVKGDLKDDTFKVPAEYQLATAPKN